MEYVDGGTLRDLLREQIKNDEKLSDNEIMKYFSQIAIAVRYLHSKNIIHRDLKPDVFIFML